MSTDNLPLRSVDPLADFVEPEIPFVAPPKPAVHPDERRMSTVAPAPARWQGRHRMPILLGAVDGMVTAGVLALAGVHWSLILAGTVLLVVLNVGAGLNHSRFSLSSLDDLPPLFGRGLLVSALVGLSTVVLGYSGIAPVVLFALPVALFLARALSYQLVRVLRRRGVITQHRRQNILRRSLLGVGRGEKMPK